MSRPEAAAAPGAPAAPGRERIAVLNWRDRRHRAAGGAELYCERIARELAAAGHEVVLVTSRPRGTAARERTDGYAVRRLGGWVSVYPLALLWLARHRDDVDAVLDSANGVPFFTPLVAGERPVVLLVHHVHQDLFARALHPLAARLARWLEGPATRSVYGRRTVVVPSPSARTAVRRRLRLRGRVRVVPGGTDTRLLEHRRAPRPRVVVVGRLTPYERLDPLVDAMVDVAARVPGAELHLVGDGWGREPLQDRVRATGAPVVFHGRLSDDERDRVLATAWLTVSSSDGGDWALSLLEANAAGVPALARRVTGVRDTVRHGETGWLVDETSAAGGADGGAAVLADALVRALTELQDPAEAARLSAGARAWAARFTWQRSAEGVLAAVRAEAARGARARRRRARATGAGERRAGNDVTVVLDVPVTSLPDGWEDGARRGDDVWARDGERVRALLPGADEVDALGLLRRLGADPADPGVSVLVARHADLLDADPTVGAARAAAAREVIDLTTAEQPADQHAGQPADQTPDQSPTSGGRRVR
ncbi:glycosyltransferase family 4 protein [Quadrisphaera sp. INWT6]|uniref:glycosyltransferase family 4 protein n=1 Tax=Quadrisphaera sp. INWT6 TaxID=2596917 RepID=UPI0018925972|nr:glycosyltransferase family 4 protein [Quadrisphaera sp. INWT6]